MTGAQRKVLEAMGSHTLYVTNGYDGGRYTFMNAGPSVHGNTGHSLERLGWIERVPRQPDDPFWRSILRITPAGHNAIAAALSARRGR